MTRTRFLIVLVALAASFGISGPSFAAPPTAADVGDADSFGRKVVWLGLVQTGAVILAADCTPGAVGPLGPEDRCVTLLPGGAATTFEFADLGRITLPGNSSATMICHRATPIVFYSFNNPTGGSVGAQFLVRATYRLESEVLRDPSLTNPITGAPFDGSIDVALTSYLDAQTLAPGVQQSHTLQASRDCIAGMVSISSLTGTYGLTEAQAKRFFKSPITVRAGVAGQLKWVSEGQVIVGTRLTGDDK